MSSQKSPAPALRRAVAAWLRRSRGVDTSPAGVLVTAGAQGAFDLCASKLRRGLERITAALADPGP